jgi:hypothetical protein
MAGIFISYRREDTAPWAGRIYERLAHQIDRGQLFMDVDNIAPGMDFVRVLEDQVGACDVILVVIGKDWAEAKNAKGQRRLDDPHDFVRIELEAAVKRDIRIIPVLVDGAQMPAGNDLPEGIRPLARRQAVELTHSRFGTDVQRLTDTLVPLVSPSAAKPTVRAVRPERPAPELQPGKPKPIGRWILLGLAGVITFLVFALTIIIVGIFLFGPSLPNSDRVLFIYLNLGFGTLSSVISYGWYRYFRSRRARET